ncbi:GNAT family N-acetyltransferase [Micromonospora aurantiaca (nom. illeg.)]|uniref:GNAT family N-acetyltransferase n=1 Tax=Micromonospora aurantiaca (nom. illeg.) TaxID=47850 RepID=UPI0037BC5224
MPTLPPSAPVQLETVLPGDDEAIAQAFELGCQFKATLGPQMRGAYEAAAKDGHLLVARSGGKVVGFALYGVAYQRVRLAYLCVAEAFRRKGLAKRIVDHLSAIHRDLAGISVKCRQSYGIDKIWISLGFHKRSEVKGRSHAGHLLTAWWRDHGHPDLFSRQDPPLLRAALDNNIIRDLGPSRSRQGASESLALVADHLMDQLELVVTTSVRREIADLEDGPVRSSCEQVMSGCTSLAPDNEAVAAAQTLLLEKISPEYGNYPDGRRDEWDLRHVASAIASKLGVFVTHDSRLISVLRQPARALGLRILEPADVVVHLDELTRAEAYRPVALLGTGYQHTALGSEQDQGVEHLASTETGEGRRDFLLRVHSLAIAADTQRSAVMDPKGEIIALYATSQQGFTLTVSLLRVASHPLRDTVARQLLLILRNQARAHNLGAIVVDDPHLGPTVQLAMLEDGFQQLQDRWTAFVIDTCGTAADVERDVIAVARHLDLPEPPPLRSTMPAVAVAQHERKWWPAKIVDTALPTYVVSIQQRWSNQLFGVPEPLWREALGLSREHVYYRAATGGPTAPARILWYMSGNKPAAPGIIACSQLELVAEGAPEELHDRFQHLGVWELSQIRGAGDGRHRQALRVTNTEIFPHPIRLPRLKVLSGSRTNLLYPFSPRKIEPELFAQLYQEGFGRHE